MNGAAAIKRIMKSVGEVTNLTSGEMSLLRKKMPEHAMTIRVIASAAVSESVHHFIFQDSSISML